MKKIICVLISFFGTFLYSQATKQDKVKELIYLSGVTNLSYEQMNEFLWDFRRRYPNVPEDFWGQISKEMNIQELVIKYIPIYEKFYSDSDIDELLKFYKSDLGRKMLSNLPIITQELKGIGKKWGQDIERKFSSELKRKNYEQYPPPSPK